MKTKVKQRKYIIHLLLIRGSMVRAQQKAPKPSQQCGGFLFLFHFQYFIKSIPVKFLKSVVFLVKKGIQLGLQHFFLGLHIHSPILIH